MNGDTKFTMLAETFFDDKRTAIEEASRIRASSKDSDVLVKVDQSPYGGYRIRVIPIDIAVDMVDSLPLFFSRR